MKILAIEKELPGIKDGDYKPHLVNEAMQVWKLYQKDIIRELFFSKDNCAVLILECINEAEAQNYLNTLPLVKEGLIKFDLITLLPYDGFERLFDKTMES